MRKFLFVAMAVVALLLAACGTTTSGTASTPTVTPAPTDTPQPSPTPTTGTSAAATISMGSTSFAGNKSVTIKAGQAVLFDDPAASGGIHNLVTGRNGTYQAMPGAPSAFTPSGIPFSPGTSTAIVFPTAGTYTITCTFHPTMLATVSVTQ
jgi:plastocyanin